MRSRLGLALASTALALLTALGAYAVTGAPTAAHADGGTTIPGPTTPGNSSGGLTSG